MPYSNMPASMQGRMEKCVSDVQGKGKDKKAAIAICYTSLMKGKELGDVLKSFDLKAAPQYRATEKASDKASDYLVVEDPKEPSKWHLQVKKNGVPDHTLMGAAWAALHGGYRGNKYEGPNKADAIAKLKALYEAEKMPLPSEKAEKAITDAPNLRGDSVQSCANCKYAMPIVTEDAMMEMAADTMPMDATAMMQAKQSGGIDLICTQYEFEAEPSWVCDSWEAVPTPVAGDMTGKATDDAELTDAELWTIDRLYLDVQAGKVVLAPLEQTDKAMVNLPHNGPPGGGTPGGGSPGRTSGKHQKCYMHLKKLGIGDDEARRVCRVALGGPELKETAIETDASLTVHKQADGHYRWIAFTSSAFKDRDGEIVSQKALEADTANMDANGYGWGDWWHTPIRLASCDFSAMHGRLSIESGIFDDDYIGEKMAAIAPELAMSRTFYHPANEPDAEGVYHHIQTFRRAFLPRGKESNLLTMLYVSKEEKEMLLDKVNELKKKLGGTKEAETKVDALLKVAEETDKAAEEAGLAFKEAATPAPVAPPEAPKDAQAPITEQSGMFVADMKPEEFDAHLKEATAKAVAELLTPVLAEVKAQIAAIGEAQAVATKEANTGIVAQFKAITEAQAALDKRLGELEGLTPRGYRATQDKETAISKEKAAELAPKQDEKHPIKDISAWVAEPVEQSPMPQ